jgi:hypothetical protein
MARVLTLPLLLLCVGLACQKAQSPACSKLIVCSEKLAPGTGASMEKSYGKNSACWKSAEQASACARVCEEALEALKANPNFATTGECK